MLAARTGAKPGVRRTHASRITPRVAAAAVPVQLTGRQKVQQWLDQYPAGQYSADASASQMKELEAAVAQMIQENPTLKPGEAAIRGGLGTGTWKVFWAPHIQAMSQSMFTRFEPILYKFYPDGSLVSNVRWSFPAVGTGWLSASGSMSLKTETSVEVAFDRFWVDMGEANLRQTLDDEETTTDMMGLQVKLDSIIGTTGRALFFPPLSVFPVLYLDDDFAVFEFPPLRSKIGIVKVPDSAPAVSASTGAANF